MHQVSNKHILRGEQFDCLHCPLALSIKDNFQFDAWVGFAKIYEYRDHVRFIPEYRYRLSRGVQNWMGRFDRGETCKPFEFEIVEEDLLKMKGEVI